MSTYELGQTITFTVQVVDDAGAAADLGGGNPTCTVTRPDGTTTTASVSKPAGAGLYWGSITSSQAGRWRGTFTGTGMNSGRLPFTDVVDVWPADPRLIISLDDAKAELNHVQDVNDDEVRLFIAATTEIVEHLVGRVLSTSLTETFNGGKTAVLLSERATAITSVTVDGVALTASEYVADLSSGIVYAGSSLSPNCFTYGRQNVVVTYTTGASSIAPSVISGARTIAAHLYASSQQSRRGRGRSGDGDGTTLVLGYAIPNAAVEKLTNQRHNRMPGIA